MKTRIPILSFSTLMCVILFSGCSKDDASGLSISKSEITIKSDQTETIVVLPDASGCTFTSENKYIANVSSEGKVTAITVGTTYVSVSNSVQNFSAKCKVTVTPVYNLYKEPYLGFGATKSTVKATEDRSLASEKSTGLIYTGENSNVSFVLYLFDGSGKMTGASVVFPINRMYATVDFLSERYIPIGYVDGYGIFMSNDEKMGVSITVYNTSYLMAVYAPKTSTKSSNSNIEIQMIDLMNSYFHL